MKIIPLTKGQISVGGQCKAIGVFKDKVDAAKAYDQEAENIYGQFAATNANLGLLKKFRLTLHDSGYIQQTLLRKR